MTATNTTTAAAAAASTSTAATVAAAQARDVTCLGPWYVFFFTLFYHTTNVYFRSTQHVEMTMAATAAAVMAASSTGSAWDKEGIFFVIVYIY